ncbi:centrosomal protein CEP120 [Marchantia polymorpha subsp. ruderalis]|uniref:Uncharacterized protein n=2 Tax=Marchantia polymorpha TaxID=3197 RepID=A0AAF6B7M8_MARPO|nr:hypothetical protein MARPO_0120s0036 [Marchantia polymorpha]BBN08012.1 hypothetical protein Mp_4g08070 [Marchantia polymorpha subsp. ruderalis]|eukprot:PTQ30760.1 hypothetical protein MARPO_0120s0036 [Marchantia polymorpha]
MEAWMDSSAARAGNNEEGGDGGGGGGGAGGGGAGGNGRMKDEELRHFRIGIDVRSFKANLRLQMRAVNVYVRVLMPQQLVNLGLASPLTGNVSKLTTPHRTHPPVAVQRGTEVTIPNGYVALELPAYVGNMASALAQKPQLVAQVLHSDRFTTDSLLGTASIPLVQLMHKPYIDGFAPVFSQTSSNLGSEGDQCVVGALRVVLSMEDLGPVRGVQDKFQKPAKYSNSHVHKSASVGTFDNFFEGLKSEYSYGARGPSRDVMKDVQNQDVDIGDSGNALNRDKKRSIHEEQLKDGQERVQMDNPNDDPTISSTLASDLQRHPAYELAWEFEMWRRTEEAKWRQDLQEKEAKALSTLERNWLKKENEMVYQIQKIQEENIGLEQKLRVKSMQLEKREKALVMAEEHFSLRREALERNLAQHNTDAQVAVKRIQAECEHRLELGQLKYAALEDQYKALDKRFASTNSSLVTLERQFSELKAAYRNTSEACLSAKVVSLQQQCFDLQQKLEALMVTRSKYKEQVLRMAKELASLQHLRLREEAKRSEDQIHSEDVRCMAAMAEAHAKRAQEERLEIRQLKEQLESLELRGISGELGTQPQKKVDFVFDLPPVELKKEDVEERRNQELEVDLPSKEAATANHSGQEQQKDLVETNAIEDCLDELLSEEASDLSIQDQEHDDTCNIDVPMNASEAQKLSVHKLNLLSSGLYTVSDPLILGLDHEISKLRSGTETHSSATFL